jgi:signal transduction histidine kinase/CheY-like chemotaxis protein
MNVQDMLKLTKEELIALVKETEERFASSNAFAAELVVALEESNEHLKTVQEQSIHDAKLISIGELASGVGHEINNPLAIISGNLDIVTQLLLKNSSDDFNNERIIKHISKCLTSVERINHIVKSLRLFSRKDAFQAESIIYCHEVIHQTLDLLKNMYYSEGIVINLDLQAEIDSVIGVVGEFQQILINLLSNAKDATAQKNNRTITISSKNEDHSIVVTITDNGHGMSEEVKSKIFDSFFTTKERGIGTGLGLSISSQFIHKMKGQIRVDSQFGFGASFNLKLPLAEVISDLKVKKIVEKYEEIRLEGKALVVDDEEDIRLILKEILEKSGLVVDLADDGDVALELVKKNKYDYILTDITMKRVSGIELIESIRSLENGKTNIFIISGAVGADVTEEKREEIQKNIREFIFKPFSKKTILGALKKYQFTK